MGTMPARGVIEEQDREIAAKSGLPPLRIKSLKRSGEEVASRIVSDGGRVEDGLCGCCGCSVIAKIGEREDAEDDQRLGEPAAAGAAIDGVGSKACAFAPFHTDARLRALNLKQSLHAPLRRKLSGSAQRMRRSVRRQSTKA